jgi:glutamate-1-semialdehyde aminotransferase
MNSQGVNFYNYAKKLIPGGTQLLSKRPEMFAPDVWPAYYSKAKGYDIWDLDDRHFIDMSIMGVGACILGYADDDVNEAVINRIKNGNTTSLNCREEIDLAEILFNLHPWFSKIRYFKSGGEAMSAAVRISRAATGRDLVLFSGYHGWTDWYLAANLAEGNNLDGQLMPGLKPTGVPRGLIGTSEPFMANSIDNILEKINGREDKVAAIVIEPARGEDAPKNYLKNLKELASKIGAVLIFDEITTGFRMCAGGIHINYGISPDIAVFAKSIANGFPISVVLGTESVMSASEATFMSSTNWTEGSGAAAAIATIKKYEQFNIHEKLINIGNKVKKIWQDAADQSGIPITITGLPTLPAFSFDNKEATKLNTYFSIQMLQNGILGFRQFKPSFAHDEYSLEKYSEAVKKIFLKIYDQPMLKELDTPIQHSGFYRLTSE